MVKQSKKELKQELNNARKINSKLREKAKQIQIVANIPTDPLEEERRLLLAQGLVVPKFLAKMQQRAQERLIRHEKASQRRLKLQQEKEEEKIAEEMRKQLEDEKAKKKRLMELREKRRQEKLAKQMKEQERQKYLENLEKARNHYARHLMRSLGFRSFELLIKLKRLNFKKSLVYRKFACMKKYFLHWRKTSKCVWDEKRAQADENFKNVVLRKSLKIFAQLVSFRRSKFLVAIDWYEMKISEKLFKKWTNFTEQCKTIEAQKMRIATAHYNW